MPIKTHKKAYHHKKHPQHYLKVYWPYLPLVIILGVGLLIGQSSAERSQRGVLSYATSVSESSLLEATNQQRTANGQNSLVTNDRLSAAAKAKAQDMVKRNYWAHNTPDGNTPWVFIDQTGYTYQKAGENLAYGFASSKDTVTGWMNSPSHKENLLDPSYREVGFGIANAPNYQDNGPETIVVAMYGNPLNASVAGAPTQGNTPAPLADTDKQPVTTASPVAKEPEVKSISKAQALTGGRMPWIGFAIGVFSGSALAFLVLKHGLAVRRAIRSSERFALKHPILDLTVLSLIALCALLSQSVGLIR